MCSVMDLRETALVSQANLKLHTILPTVLAVEPSATVTTLLALVAIGVRSTSCLAIDCLLTEVGEQTASVNETVDAN